MHMAQLKRQKPQQQQHWVCCSTTNTNKKSEYRTMEENMCDDHHLWRVTFLIVSVYHHQHQIMFILLQTNYDDDRKSYLAWIWNALHALVLIIVYARCFCRSILLTSEKMAKIQRFYNRTLYALKKRDRTQSAERERENVIELIHLLGAISASTLLAEFARCAHAYTHTKLARYLALGTGSLRCYIAIAKSR